MAIVITEVTKVTDAVQDVLSGTGVRRATFNVRVTTDATGNTIDLSSYDSNLTGIEEVPGQAIAGATAATSVTWTGTTITFAGHTGSGVTTLTVKGTYS